MAHTEPYLHNSFFLKFPSYLLLAIQLVFPLPIISPTSITHKQYALCLQSMFLARRDDICSIYFFKLSFAYKGTKTIPAVLCQVSTRPIDEELFNSYVTPKGGYSQKTVHQNFFNLGWFLIQSLYVLFGKRLFS